MTGHEIVGSLQMIKQAIAEGVVLPRIAIVTVDAAIAALEACAPIISKLTADRDALQARIEGMVKSG